MRRLAVSALLVLGAMASISATTASAAPPAPVTLEATVTIPTPVFGGILEFERRNKRLGVVREDRPQLHGFLRKPTRGRGQLFRPSSSSPARRGRSR